jgi:hypothetical protein
MGTTILTIFEELKAHDPLVNAKLNSKRHLQKQLFVFSTVFLVRLASKFKTNMAKNKKIAKYEV